MGDGHGGIDKVASSWTLHGWSPPWTRATVTLRGLKSPSMWMYDNTTLQKKDTSVTFWAEQFFFCHTYDTSMTIIVKRLDFYLVK